MAVKYLEKCTANPWRVYWRNPYTGKQESAFFATKAEAQKEDAKVKYRLKFERESFRRETVEENTVEGIEDGRITLEGCFVEYLKYKQFSKKALEGQMYSMRPSLEMLGQTAIADITLPMLKKFVSSLQEKGFKPATVIKRASSLRAVLRWGADNGLCEQKPFPRLMPANHEKFVPPSPKELVALMHAAPPHIQRVLVIGSQLGARVGPSELLKMQWCDIDLQRHLVRIRGANKNKNAPWREVPIREELIPVFEEWKAQDRQVGLGYLIHYKGKPIESIQTTWKATLRRAGISRRIRPYDLRHAFATELIAGGTDIGTVASLMGHSTPSMLLKHYQFVMDRQKRAAVETLPSMGLYATACMQ